MVPKPVRVLYAVFVVLAFSSWSVYALQYEPAGVSPAQVKQLAPALRAQSRSGQTLNLRAFRGKWVLVNFWATWCPPCRREMASLERLATKMKGKPFVLLAVSVDQNWKNIDGYLRKHKVLGPRFSSLNMRILWDRDARSSTRFGTRKYPETYWIDPKGIVRAKIIGEKKWDSPKVLKWVHRWMTTIAP